MKKTKNYLSIISILLIVLIFSKNISPQNTKASEDEISENTEFVYYIDVYRNFSLNENEQTWQETSDLLNINNDLTKSDYIFVEDKLSPLLCPLPLRQFSRQCSEFGQTLCPLKFAGAR